MKRSEICSFVTRFLELRGAQVERTDDNLLAVTPPWAKDIGDRVQRYIAFGTRAHRAHPEAELAAIGSAYLDRVVHEATNAGRYAVSYVPAPEMQPFPGPKKRRLPQVSGGRWGRPTAAYRPLFLFVYVAEYRTIDVPDDLEMIALDPARGEMIPSAGPLLDALRSGSCEAPKGWMRMTAFPTPGTVRRSLRELDQRLRRRARKVKEAAALEIARETANIEAYYRQLIDEVRHPVGRGRMTPENEAERVRSLQLDWKRRVQEVARFWEAGASVRLSALGVVMQPCWAIPLRGRGPRGGARGKGPVCLVRSFASGALVKPRCPLCGDRIADEAELIGADLICAAHLERAGGAASASM